LCIEGILRVVKLVHRIKPFVHSAQKLDSKKKSEIGVQFNEFILVVIFGPKLQRQYPQDVVLRKSDDFMTVKSSGRGFHKTFSGIL
jgi:hypothetical protein